MSEFLTRRRLRRFDVTVGTAVSSSSAIRADDCAAGAVYVSGVTASALLTLYGSAAGENYLPVSGPDGTPSTVSIPDAGGAVSLPAPVAGLGYLKLVSGTDLGTAVAVLVTLKS
jgi:hypothetical protein